MQIHAPEISAAAELIKTKDYVGAETKLRAVLDFEPNNADALQLLGLVLKNTDRLDAARETLLDSLSLNAKQPNVHNNLGGVFLRLGDAHRARSCFEEALKLNRNYKEAWRNLAIAHQRTGRLDEAEKAARHAVQLDGDFGAAVATLGRICLEGGREDEAVKLLLRAVSLVPQSHEAWHYLGAALRSASRRPEAVEALLTALKINPKAVETYALLGGVYQDMGDLESAKHAFTIATEARPDYEEAHFALSQILYMSGQENEFLRSYVRAEARSPEAIDIRCAHAQTLMFLDRDEEAEKVLRDAEVRAADHVRVKHVLGRVLSKLGRHDEAIAYHEQAIKAAPARPDFRTASARTFMYAGDFAAAAEQLAACDREAARAMELDQEVLALTYTCARQQGSSEAQRLYDYETLVQGFEIEPPKGFASADAFNDALSERLLDLHTQQKEPIEQSLRGGTQTHGRLFKSDDPMIVSLREAISKTVERYIEQLPELGNHPFELARPDHCRFAGSWSVRLCDGGFHKNHIHPRGWLSSAYYVKLPKEIGAAPDDRQGWLKFGQPHDLPGFDQPPEHWIKPEPGLLALFPSYMWHGTEAFHSANERITVAFDVQPLRPTARHLGRL